MQAEIWKWDETSGESKRRFHIRWCSFTFSAENIFRTIWKNELERKRLFLASVHLCSFLSPLLRLVLYILQISCFFVYNIVDNAFHQWWSHPKKFFLRFNERPKFISLSYGAFRELRIDIVACHGKKIFFSQFHTCQLWNKKRFDLPASLFSQKQMQLAGSLAGHQEACSGNVGQSNDIVMVHLKRKTW